MKKRIIFACRWNRVLEKSWSGSKYAIYKELSKRYEIQQFVIKDTFSVKGFKLFRRIGLIKGEPSILPIIQKYNKRYRKLHAHEDAVVIQFDEVPWTPKTSNYIYQDLAVEYISYIKERDKQAYLCCGFSNIKESEIERRKEIQNAYYEHCSGVFCMSNWLADFLVENLKVAREKVHVVGAGINVPIKDVNYSLKKGKRILFVGRDFYRKGGELVLDAFNILRVKYIESAELYIIGPKENPLKNEMKNVFYVGDIKNEEILKYYEICDIFCMPSYFEPFGIAFCEALVYGLPCIARKKYAMQEIITDGEDGCLINSDEPEELAEKMKYVLGNAAMRKNVRDKRQYYIEKYSWENVANQMASVIEKNEGW